MPTLPTEVLPLEPGSYVSATTLGPSWPSATIPVTKGLFVPTAGAVIVTMSDGAVVTFTGVLAGTTLPIRVTRIESGTVPLAIVALY